MDLGPNRLKRAGFTLVEIVIVVLIIGILLAIALPNFSTASSASRSKACIGNLKEIDTAKQQYLIDYKQGSTYPFTSTYSGTTANELVPNYIRSFPVCPSGGTYSINSGAFSPTCSYVNTRYPHSLT